MTPNEFRNALNQLIDEDYFDGIPSDSLFNDGKILIDERTGSDITPDRAILSAAYARWQAVDNAENQRQIDDTLTLRTLLQTEENAITQEQIIRVMKALARQIVPT